MRQRRGVSLRRRRLGFRVPLAIAVLCPSIAGGMAAQGKTVAGRTAAILGEVRAAAGGPLVGARVHAISQASKSLPWLPSAATTVRQVARTDARGRFAFPSPTRISLWIETGAAVALVIEAAPGVPVFVPALPSCRIRLGAGSRGAWVSVDGVSLGFLAGPVLSVPAGRLELLVEDQTGPFVAGCRSEPGGEVLIRRPEKRPARITGLPTGAVVRLEPWPARKFVAVAGAALRLPTSPGPRSVRVSVVATEGETFESLWVEVGAEVAWQPRSAAWREIRVCDGQGQPLRGVRVATVRDGPGRPILTALSTTDAAGLGYHRAGSVADRVVLVGEDHAGAVLGPVVGDSAQIEPAASLRLRIVDPEGRPVVGAQVRTGIDPLLDQTGESDGRGGVTLQGLPAVPFTIRVVHPLHLSRTVPVDPAAQGTVDVVLSKGRILRGVVTCADASRLAGVVVEVRDPSGASGLEPRVVRADAAGRFRFEGLPDGELTLFAHGTDAGLTWSGTRSVRAGSGGKVTVSIECDDPKPPSSDR